MIPEWAIVLSQLQAEEGKAYVCVPKLHGARYIPIKRALATIFAMFYAAQDFSLMEK